MLKDKLSIKTKKYITSNGSNLLPMSESVNFISF